MNKPSVFISYSSKDLATVEKIHQQLEANGFAVWRDKSRLETDWSREIANALADSDVLCLIWTEHSAISKWVKHEWLTARALEKKIIVCRFADKPELPEPLRNLDCIQVETIANSCELLIKRLRDESGLFCKYDYTILPPNSYIPFNPNPNFTGRGRDLLNLYLKMIGNLNKIGINQVGAVGMGGIGKTQLAVEFAYRFSFAFDSIYWIQAADDSAWRKEFVDLARIRLQLQISDASKDDDEKQFIYALQRHIKDHPGTLIIMDNISEPKFLNNDAYLFGLTPLVLGCDLLFTTRKHFDLNGVSSQQVDVLSPESAYTLLTSDRKPDNDKEDENVHNICKAVGNLPLAITLINARLKKFRQTISFSDFYEELYTRS